MDYVAKREEVLEIMEAVKAQLGGSFSAREDGHRDLAVIFSRKEEGRTFDKEVVVAVDEYKGAKYTAVSFRGESCRDNNYSPAYASIIPHDKAELRQLVRFALACAFNKEVDL